MNNTITKEEKAFKQGELPDGWEDCLSVIRRLILEQLEVEEKDQARWGHEPVLSIESFRNIVEKIINSATLTLANQ